MVIVTDPSHLKASFPRVVHRAIGWNAGVPYEIHEGLGTDSVYITMLTEPVARVVSMMNTSSELMGYRLQRIRRQRNDVSRFVASDIDPRAAQSCWTRASVEQE